MTRSATVPPGRGRRAGPRSGRPRETGYAFTTVTPATHAHVNARPRNAEARTLRDVFGWSRPFRAEVLRRADPAPDAGGRRRHRGRPAAAARRSGSPASTARCWPTRPTRRTPPMRCSSVPTRCASSAAVIDHLESRHERRCAGRSISAAARAPPASASPSVRRGPRSCWSTSTRRPCGRRASTRGSPGPTASSVRRSDMLRDVEGRFDLIVSNPPFMIDPPRAGLSPWRRSARRRPLACRGRSRPCERLAPGGSLVLFTGAAIVEGEDPFREAVTARLRPRRPGLDLPGVRSGRVRRGARGPRLRRGGAPRPRRPHGDARTSADPDGGPSGTSSCRRCPRGPDGRAEVAAGQVSLGRDRLRSVRQDLPQRRLLSDRQEMALLPQVAAERGPLGRARRHRGRVRQRREPQDPHPPGRSARSGRLRGHRHLRRVSGGRDPAARTGLPGHRHGAGLRRLLEAGPASRSRPGPAGVLGFYPGTSIGNFAPRGGGLVPGTRPRRPSGRACSSSARTRRATPSACSAPMAAPTG